MQKYIILKYINSLKALFLIRTAPDSLMIIHIFRQTSQCFLDLPMKATIIFREGKTHRLSLPLETLQQQSLNLIPAAASSIFPCWPLPEGNEKVTINSFYLIEIWRGKG